MRIEHWVPGVVATPAAFAIPVTAPDIYLTVEAEIKRIPQVVGAHAAGAVDLAHAATAVAVAHVNAAVDAHAVHAHALISQGLGGAVTIALGWDGAAPAQMEDGGAAALHTFPGGGATGVQDFTVPAHVVNPQPDNHAGADILAAVDDHAVADVAAAIADHAGVDPDIGAIVVARVTKRTISLDTNLQIHDILILTYHEVGSRVSVA